MRATSSILILGGPVLTGLEDRLGKEGWKVRTEPLDGRGEVPVSDDDYAVVLVLPDENTDLASLIALLRERKPGTGVLVLGDCRDGFPGQEAVRCLPETASPESILEAVLESTGVPASRPGRTYPFGTIVGQSSNIEHVFNLISKVAKTDSTVLITGESGTGKELIAQAIHHESRRREKPLIAVNCGAIPEELLESELFGHEKGAFTSAIRTRIGRFELAEGGTVFLDEIGEMSPQLQVKLLRILQEHQFERVGGTRTINADIRVVAATNQNLLEAVQEGRFREDLYYRLDVIPIQAPALRDRSEDIKLLVEHFLERFNRSREATLEGLDARAMSALVAYDWPGNVRELENLMERMAILCDGPIITLNDLPERFSGVSSGPLKGIASLPDQGFSLTAYLAQVEDDLIRQALEKAEGIKKKAADLLGINRTTLVEKMKKKGMM